MSDECSIYITQEIYNVETHTISIQYEQFPTQITYSISVNDRLPENEKKSIKSRNYNS